ncbi:MAG TPA: hypothetical protein VNC22_04490 [Sporichthya sp.]|jgi:hypothetical protein|nr:hypothetical protein [Sporichthya sp.]
MSVDFDSARRLVRDHLLDRWRSQDGRLVVFPRGFEDATHWRVIVAADPVEPAEDDPAAPPIDLSGRAFLVDKSSGAVSETSVTDPRIAAMTPWGPPD